MVKDIQMICSFSWRWQKCRWSWNYRLTGKL